jgi:hypothetical protein
MCKICEIITRWCSARKVRIKITTSDGVSVRGKNLGVSMFLDQKVKATANVNGAIVEGSLEATQVNGQEGTVVLERIEGELAYWIKAGSVGTAVVEIAAMGTNGTRIAALVEITVEAISATELTITLGEPEPQ